MRKLIRQLPLFISVLLLVSCAHKTDPSVRTLPLTVLRDKIAGGWAGKMIGVTYGAPTEFRAKGKTYEDPIKWKPSDVKGSVWQDDIYVQLTFLMTMDRYGMDASSKKYQELFAKAGYPLWHANVQARKNYFDSIFPPQSGSPEFNLHADDIDFQIEADYIGFMCPGMSQTAARLADKTGHIMNYGDGFYGGVFVAALYAEAFFEKDIPTIIEKALLSLPAESDYARIIQDVILLHEHYSTDWRAAWSELETKWGSEHICEPGTNFNIDAKVNGAYIALGLLYGNGDPAKTLEITARCGQDSDCNPSNAMAVLGVINGFSGLPAPYREAVQAMGDSLFINTSYSFNKAVENTLGYACRLVAANGGKVTGKEISIKTQSPRPLPLETSFPKVVFDKRVNVFEKEGWRLKGDWKTYSRQAKVPGKKIPGQALYCEKKGSEISFTFEGTGVSLCGNWLRDGGKADVFVDGTFRRTIDCFFYFAGQEHLNMDLFHIMGLQNGKHTIRITAKGEKREESLGTRVYITEAVVFKTGDKVSENTLFPFLE